MAARTDTSMRNSPSGMGDPMDLIQNQTSQIPMTKPLVRTNSYSKIIQNSKPKTEAQQSYFKMKQRTDQGLTADPKIENIISSVLDIEVEAQSKGNSISSIKHNKEKEPVKLKPNLKKHPKLKLMPLLWAMTYHFLLGKDMEDKVEKKRKAFEQGIQKQVQEHMSTIEEFIKKTCQNSLKSLYGEKSSLVLVEENRDKDKIKDKDLRKRLEIITVKNIS